MNVVSDVTIQCLGLKVCDTSYFFSVFVCSKITGITRTNIFVVKDFLMSVPYNMDCIFDRNLNRCVRLVILNLFAVS